MNRFTIKRAYTCEHECKEIHKYISIGVDRKSRLPISTCARKFGNSELASISQKLFLYNITRGRRLSRKKTTRVICYNFKRGCGPDVCSAQDSEAHAWRRVIKGNILDKGEKPKKARENAPFVQTHVKSGRIEEEISSTPFPNVLNYKNILCNSSKWGNTDIWSCSKMRRMKFRNFTQIVAVSIKKDKYVKFSRLSLSELLPCILGHLSEKNDIKTWNSIFLQVDKLVSKKGGGEEYKAELSAFFDKMTNMEYYAVLHHLKDIDESVKNNILNGAFFECLVMALKGRDITYLNERMGWRGVEEKEVELADSSQIGVDSPTEVGRGDPAQIEKKRGSKVKSYMRNLKHLLNISGSRMGSKGGSSALEEQQWQSEGEEKRLDHLDDNEVVSCPNNLAASRGNTQKDVTMIRRWFTLLSYMSSKSENVTKLRDYLNRIFRKHIDELIRKEYFSKTVNQMTNQINSKSVHALIMTYEKKLDQMEAYDFSYSLIILHRFLVFSDSLFNRIIDQAIGNPLAKLKSEKHLIRFIKSVDNYLLINPSSTGFNRAGDSGAGFNNTEIFQSNMNDLYNSTFSIFIKKLNKKLKYYSLDNLLFFSECLGKVIFMPSTQNQVLHVFINKLRYYIDNALNSCTVDNETLIRLFKINSFFSFVPEMEIFVSCRGKGGRKARRFVKGEVSIPSEGTVMGEAENASERGTFPSRAEGEMSPVKESPSPTGNRKILKNRNDDTLDDKSKKKSICFNLSEKEVINYYYDKSEEAHTFVNPKNLLKSYDLLQVKDNVYDVKSYLLSYGLNQDVGKKHKKNKFLLKNIVALLCEQIDKSLDDVAKELGGGFPGGKKEESETSPNKGSVFWSREKLVDEIKHINEKSAEGDLTHKESELYKRYLIFYDFSVLSDIVKFTHFSINTNKHTYELVKSIKRRLEEMLLFYDLNVVSKGGSGLPMSGSDSNGSKMKNITTFQLYHFYCACKNFSPSFLFEFFDTMLKMTPRINIIDMDKTSDLFSKKKMNKMEHVEIFQKVRDRKVTIPFVVSLLGSLKIIISSNLFLMNDILSEHVNTMVQYSYYVLLYYYYNKDRMKRQVKGDSDLRDADEEEWLGGGARTVPGNSPTGTHAAGEQNSQGPPLVNNEQAEEEEEEEEEYPTCESASKGGTAGSSPTGEYVKNQVEGGQLGDGSDCSISSSVIKSTRKNRRICLFDNVYMEDLCNTYLCLSTSLYFLNRTEEKSNQVKHLIYLEERFLRLVTKVKYMKYLSDNLIFFLFKAPCTVKLEEAFDGVIPSLKVSNRRGKKTSELLSSIKHSQKVKILSLPAATAILLCKIKLSMLGSKGKEEVNALRMENTRKLFEILMDDYKLLKNCVEQLFINRGRESVDGGGETINGEREYSSDNSYLSDKSTSFRGGSRMSFSMEDNQDRSSQYELSARKRRTYSYLPYLVSGRVDVKQNAHLEGLIGDMFFGEHEVKTLYELQRTLIKTAKYLEATQINLKVNYKITQIHQIHNDVLGYLSELSSVVKDCLYIVFLSQPYVHKSPKKYITRNLVNYFINKSKFVSDYNILDDYNNKSFNELKRSKYMANDLCG
ncbi:conserved Plasmodium protein, unknown function [Plasmodium knowlesi strain H]|uniref:Uncharacterized protein n=3 Tax=Plasmodium knowlesi TaxID=5850 RepID=A0A5K1UTY6_PLAKH|nr:conserved Plasmodium protein, unknown function [Plasmodium knowlesi strain H]OTN64485.1 Uncharacterized protein PKNOH_S130213400 [Plasmodium knowlesi]CAA9989294.1 conserved Plasmodium protein, unknown function [Plasmodium knowlesi strain H]SBO26130.1 conserved Plasmodium protein, unknown function [Plasmodium knowlesi strain H]SBO26804.1 conserved Plasmodium protein, unknown function [Plasmodium knowlesi strain H]VVS78768.1 conserved Plasmodium protein, unknown function [Plasmodium knowlesi |eukprot:XP_002261641.1 hypothetical protein, conserved in Plasmodium species [Plasmodium knowlesi strain H]